MSYDGAGASNQQNEALAAALAAQRQREKVLAEQRARELDRMSYRVDRAVRRIPEVRGE